MRTCLTSRGSLVRIQYRPQLIIKTLWHFCFKVFFVMYTVLDTLNPCLRWSNGKAKLSQHRCLVVTYPLIDYLPTFPKILPQTNEARKLPPFIPVSSPEIRQSNKRTFFMRFSNHAISDNSGRLHFQGRYWVKTKFSSSSCLLFY